MTSNSDKIKQDVYFLRHDVNLKNEYQLVKSGRSVLNLKKEQLFKTSHGQVLNYFLIVRITTANIHLMVLVHFMLILIFQKVFNIQFINLF